MSNFLIQIFDFIWIMFFMNIILNIFYELKRYFKIIHLDKPIDFGAVFLDKKRLLGESTTVGGLLITVLIGFILNLFFPGADVFLKVFIVYFGHAIGSFIKRRLNKKRGEYVPILNHADYIILASIIFVFLGKIDLMIAIFSIIVVAIITPIITHISYFLGIRDNKL